MNMFLKIIAFAIAVLAISLICSCTSVPEAVDTHGLAGDLLGAKEDVISAKEMTSDIKIRPTLKRAEDKLIRVISTIPAIIKALDVRENKETDLQNKREQVFFDVADYGLYFGGFLIAMGIIGVLASTQLAGIWQKEVKTFSILAVSIGFLTVAISGYVIFYPKHLIYAGGVLTVLIVIHGLGYCGIKLKDYQPKEIKDKLKKIAKVEKK